MFKRVLLAISALVVTSAHADRIYLVDGRVFEGLVIREGQEVVADTVIANIRTRLTLKASDIDRIERAPVPDDFFDVPQAPDVRDVDDDGQIQYLEIPIQGRLGEQVFARGVYDSLRHARRNKVRHIVFTIDSDGGDGDEAALFSFADVVDGIATKMHRRHPHVFGEESIGSADEQNLAWEAHKQSERAAAGETGVLDGVARSLPALLRARKLGKRAAGVGFDWPDPDGVRAKVDEELGELDEARHSGNQAAVSEEFGDLLFAIANLGRHLDIDPEEALREANDKFERRFRAVEAGLHADQGRWEDESLDALEKRWADAKRQTLMPSASCFAGMRRTAAKTGCYRCDSCRTERLPERSGQTGCPRYNRPRQ